MTETEPYVLHVLPAPECLDLPTLDPECLTAAFMLELTIPEQYCLRYTVNSESSPSGTLPYLVHDHRTVSSIQSILKYAESSAGTTYTPKGSSGRGIDATLGPVERAQSRAWCAHVASHLGDLVVYYLYASNENWTAITQPALCASLPSLHRRFVSRLRSSILARLEKANLFTVVDEVEEEPKSFAERQKKQREKMPFGQFKETFGRQKIVERAMSDFGIYSNMLASKPYFFGDRLTALDTYLASHVLVLTLPSFPDSLLRDLLLDSFPTLVNHARRVLSTVFPSGFTDIPRSAEAPPGVSALLPRVTLSGPRSSRGDVERSFDRARWLWYAGALLGSIAYVAFFTPIRIVLVQDEGKGDGDYGGDEGAEKDDVPPKADDTDNEEDEEEGWTTHG